MKNTFLMQTTMVFLKSKKSSNMIKANLLVIFGIISSWSFAQDKTEYIVMNPDCNCQVFYVRDTLVNTHTYKYQNIKNKEYVVLKSHIDSLSELINNSKKEILVLNDSLHLLSNNPMVLTENDRRNIISAKTHYTNALKQHNASNILNRNTNNILQVITMGNSSLDRTSIPYEKSLTDMYSTHIKNTTQNIQMLDSLLWNDSIVKNENTRLISLISIQRDSLLQKQNLHSREQTNIQHNIRVNQIEEYVYDYVQDESIIRNITYVDTSFFVQNFNGSYSAIYERYFRIIKDKYQFIENEIIQEDSLKQLIANPFVIRDIGRFITSYFPQSSTGYLFEDTETKQMYFTNCNFLSICAIEKNYYFAMKFLQSQGGDFFEVEDNTIVTYRNASCKATPLIIEHLANNNITIITKMHASVSQYQQLQKQAADKIDSMVKLRNLYRARLLTENDLIQWKKITSECLSILSNMRGLPFADLPEYHTQIMFKNDCKYTVAEIIDIATNCKTLLGL